ncbi:hypothetical protein [Streptococcus orisratti]|uniref:hypothetical protein n=1 Tax=Streptococcus orisratti TaxID=114652 RepID=UPI003CFFED58
MQELNLTIEQSLTLIAILTPLVIYLWHHLGTFQLDIEPKNTPEGKDTGPLTNANYGAYIQSQGRYYN